MYYSTIKKILGALFIAVLLATIYGVGRLAEREPEIVPEKTSGEASAVPVLHERSIYACRIGAEETPAVQIYQVENLQGEPFGIKASVKMGGEEIAVTAPGADAEWDYRSVSAVSEQSRIAVAFAPTADAEREDDWILTLADERTGLTARVKDCTEISDE